ncbi:hypothetical protein PaecuDRAFT_0862 [Paenibacillus curdlanolyticus YK9]|uniref:Uncharacterized protein n=1 Tax=Paenibacillus curdlanolyticus YK9 TaxID=717606 RepID=E0I5E0_9BACL|nr:hypothetical protein [Paenibacillus curdlanolyticus]EFM12182.1 hypothetical protein PaecuDRAFT_0862 [Paenibacillus curdlanolyticus YK9]
MQIQLFDPIMDIPYYYPCNLPLVHEVLKRQGSESRLSLLANSRLYGLPACSSLGLVKQYFNKLDYEDAVWLEKGKRELPSYEAGVAEIRSRINDGELFLATGTSYYLPYCEDYLNPNYIAKLVDPDSRRYLVDHWLAVYGVSDDQMLIYDPVPSRYAGPLSSQAFGDFWRGNKSIPELATAKRKEELHIYCTVDVESEATLTPTAFREAMQQTLATLVYEFLAGQEIHRDGRVYYFGNAVTLQLLKRLHLGAVNGETEISAISTFLFDMRWSRYFFRDLLNDMGAILGAPYDAYAAEFALIVGEWEQAHKMMQGRWSQEEASQRIRLVSSFVEQLGLREHRLYESMWAEHRNIGLFGKKRSESEGAKSKQREMLAKIVLDSCMDLNQFHKGSIPVELGLQAPLYGRNGNLDSLGLVSLLAAVEQSIQEELGIGIALSEIASAGMPDSPYRTVGGFVDYLIDRMPEAG